MKINPIAKKCNFALMNNPIKTKQELINVIQSHKNDILTYGIRRIGIFGSFVRDDVKDNSDVDFFIDFYPEYKTLKNFVGLAHYLQNLLGRKVEIVTPQSLNKFIGKYITQQVEYVTLPA